MVEGAHDVAANMDFDMPLVMWHVDVEIWIGLDNVVWSHDTLMWHFDLGLGEGSNSYAELMALNLILKFVVDKLVEKIQNFGDSLLVIN